jgi:predicted secreted protein
MAGLDGFGSKFYRMSGTSSTAVAGVTAINGPEGESEQIDVSDMDNANGFREFLPGIVDAGEVELELNYTKAEMALLYALWRTTAAYKIVFSDSSNFSFNGFMAALGAEAPFDDKVGASATFKITGKPTFATQ